MMSCSITYRKAGAQLLIIVAYLSLVSVVSVVTFVVYGFDKRQAANGGRRIPEQTLHLLALAGGWPGALVGQRLFRHKTQKLSFLVVFWLTVLLHLSLVAAVAYALFRQQGWPTA